MRIHVTRENILRGRRVGTMDDPIYVAMSEQGLYWICYDRNWMSHECRSNSGTHITRCRYATPWQVRWFLWLDERGLRRFIPSFSFEVP